MRNALLAALAAVLTITGCTADKGGVKSASAAPAAESKRIETPGMIPGHSLQAALHRRKLRASMTRETTGIARVSLAMLPMCQRPRLAL